MAMKTLVFHSAHGFEKLVFWSYMVLLAVLAYSWLGELPVYASAAPCCISQLCCCLLVSYIFELTISMASLICSKIHESASWVDYTMIAMHCIVNYKRFLWSDVKLYFTLRSWFSFDFIRSRERAYLKRTKYLLYKFCHQPSFCDLVICKTYHLTWSLMPSKCNQV